MFYLSKTSLDRDSLQQCIEDDGVGAVVSFDGKVRNQNEGKAVTALEYEAYEVLAVSEANKILAESKERFAVHEVAAAHRVGQLGIGEVAVVVVVAAVHRKAAFAACQFVMDELKQRLPIWKKEYYADGSAEWVSCQGCKKKVKFEEKNYYSRQLGLKEIGPSGQQSLKNSRVLVVGAGGLGCPALSYLTAAGIGHITLCDADKVEISNLHRQVLYSCNDVGKHKVTTAKRHLQRLNPFVTISTIDQMVDVYNVENIVQGHDVVLDCTDSMTAKFLLHDACYLNRVPFVLAGVYQLEGLLQVFDRSQGTGCLRCQWPSLPEEVCTGTCAEVGVIGTVPGVLGTMQAMEAIKIILNMSDVANSVAVLVDLATNRMSQLRRKKKSLCPLCGDNPTIREINPCNYGHGPRSEWEWDLSEKSEALLHDCDWIDIRDAEERDTSLPWIQHLFHIPLSEVNRFHLIDKNRDSILVCQKGIRSRKLLQELRDQGLTQFVSVSGGVGALEAYWKRCQKEIL